MKLRYVNEEAGAFSPQQFPIANAAPDWGRIPFRSKYLVPLLIPTSSNGVNSLHHQSHTQLGVIVAPPKVRMGNLVAPVLIPGRPII